ncbi:RNA-directed DNA polymerase from mobile element jockey [Paramuricea clavata]|uniref:RNA-directed DNA polymerase from mobile element jockey n=1 Tax=Paramuricea clavata TaxID=317549 RepID=A0A6S7J3V2_PARCT|nr:RNA-directed DNA polymerase from mobile element jockey [Paramuricea clavata]
MFADDSKCYRVIETSHDTQLLQSDLHSLCNWSSTSELKFNLKKCIGIRFSRKRLIESPEYSLNHELITLKSSQKDLGIIISNNLKWSPQINNIVSKANQMLGFLRRNCIHLTDMKCRRSLYLALVRAHLSYGSELWAPQSTSKDLLRIESVQRRASKYILQDYHSSYADRLKLLNLLPISYCGSSGETSQSKSKGFSLESFEKFKRQKESQRSSFFVRKKGRKSSSKEDKEVVIYIGLMKEMCQVKRGEWLPLKIKSSATADDILEAAIQKHSTFNKRFNSKLKYKLVFKDGSEVSNIPGGDHEESFVLFTYKELSGFSYGKIKLFLIPEITSFQNRIDQLKSCLEEAEDDELSSESEEQALFQNPLSCETNSVNSSNNDHCITNQSTETETIEIPDEEAMAQSVLGNPPEKDGAAININVECPLCLKIFPNKRIFVTFQLLLTSILCPDCL